MKVENSTAVLGYPAGETALQALPSEDELQTLLLMEAQRRRREDRVDIQETMRKRGEEELKQWKQMLDDMQKAREKRKTAAQPPKVNLQRMTQNLVSAVTASDVRTVISEASRAVTALEGSLGGLSERQKQQVRAMIQSAQKLLARCSRKLEDLGREDVTRGRQKQAEKAQQKKSAEKIKQELRQEMTERQRREQRYLLDRFPTAEQPGLQRSTQLHPAQKLDFASEAKIEAMAQNIARAEGAFAAGQPAEFMADAAAGAGEGSEAQAAASAPAAE